MAVFIYPDPFPFFVMSGIPDRTRFFCDIAAKTGNVRLAALTFYITVCGASKDRPGVWTAKHLGDQIGVSRWDIYKLLDLAVLKYCLLYRRTTKGLRIWPNPGIGKRFNLKKLGFYRLSAAKQFGITAAVILETIDPEPHECLERYDKKYKRPKITRELLRLVFAEQRTESTITAAKVRKLYPWANKRTIRHALRTLLAKGWLACGDSPRPRYRMNTDDPIDQYLEPVRSLVPFGENGEPVLHGVYTLKKSRWKKKTPGKKSLHAAKSHSCTAKSHSCTAKSATA